MASAGSYHKLPEPDDLIECPYDKSHVIRFKKLPYHLLKCKENHPVSYESCPFDARHQVAKADLALHMETCPQRALVEQDIAHALMRQDDSEDHQLRAETKVPPYDAWEPPEPEEDWGTVDTDSHVTWTAPVRDRQWLIADRGYTAVDTLDTGMQQLRVAEQSPGAAHHSYGRGAVPLTFQHQGQYQPSQKASYQPQPWPPLAASHAQQPRPSPPSIQHQQPGQSSPVLHSNQESWQSSPGKPQQQQLQSHFPRSPLLSSSVQQPDQPGFGTSQMLPVGYQPWQAGRGRGIRPLPISSAGRGTILDARAKETISQDPGRSRIAANFQNAGIAGKMSSDSRAPELKAGAVLGGYASASRQAGAEVFSEPVTDPVRTDKKGQPTAKGDGFVAGDPTTQLQLKLKKIVKKLRQINELEEKGNLDDDQRRKVGEKPELERQRNAISEQLKQVGSTWE